MKIQQFAITNTDFETICTEMKAIKMLPENFQSLSEKEIYQHFLYQCFPEILNENSKVMKLKALRANATQDVWQYLQEDAIEVAVFYHIALQLLGFLEEVDYQADAVLPSVETIGLPIFKTKGNVFTNEELIQALHLLLQTHGKLGLNFIDMLASKGFFKSYANTPMFFAGKALPTFDSQNCIREVVYVETDVDTDGDGLCDLVKVEIVRPQAAVKIPALFTASPYNQGTNPEISDKKLHDVNLPLSRKEPTQTTYEDIRFKGRTHDAKKRVVEGETSEIFETFQQETSYSLNDYFLARGFASVYATGIGGKESDGIMTCASIEQTHSMQAVVEWLNGSRKAFANRVDGIEVKAHWCNGSVAMTGKSYLGTLATAVATTGVKGLETIVSEAAISNWYGYYRENGLVIAPGGYPGEDADILAELTYSRRIQAGDYLYSKTFFDQKQEEMKRLQDRVTGNYNTFWDERNYLPHVQNIKCDVVIVHGLNDWNVKPRQAFELWQELQNVSVAKKIILHQGQHIYINNNRSLDFTDMMNLWFSHKLYKVSNQAKEILPDILWQENTKAESWKALEEFPTSAMQTFSLTKDLHLSDAPKEQGELSFNDHLTEEKFEDFKKKPAQFVKAIQEEKNESLQQNRLFFTTQELEEDFCLNGSAKISFKIKSSVNKGMLSARLIDLGAAKRLGEVPKTLALKAIDRGVNFRPENLMEFALEAETEQKLITLGHMNLQNRENVWKNDELHADEFVDVTFDLQPTIYTIPKGRKIALVVYSTDFEYTMRGNEEITYTLDLSGCSLSLPYQDR